MKLEQQVTNLELSKRLKELGVKKKSLFSWVGVCDDDPEHPDEIGYNIEITEESGKRSFYIGDEIYSAFTVAELGEMLPKDVFVPYGGYGSSSKKKRKYPQHLHCFFGIERAFVNYTGGNSQEHLTQGAETEADARAKMLIYLIENDLITLKQYEK